MTDRDEPGPERTCAVTRQKGHPDAMIRFVLGPGATVVPDIRRKLPGRGVWVTAEMARVAEAVRKGGFARGFKAKVVADPALAETVGELLDRDALQSLAMANKAGTVTTGFAKVEAALAAGQVAGLLHASDAAEDGIRKLDAVGRTAGRGSSLNSIKLFTSQQLDLALGRTNVIHAALAVGPASEAFLTRCRRSISYRAQSAHSKDDAGAASA